MSKKLLIIITLVVVLLIGGMGAGFFLMWNKMAAMNPANATQNKSDEKETEEKPAEFGPVYTLKPFIVNLADPGGKRYLRMSMDLELKTEEASLLAQKRLPQIRDAILMIVPTKRTSDISSVEGKIALRDEIITRLNGFLKSGAVTNIYFTEFVIQ
jgi:flagellar FliL protein